MPPLPPRQAGAGLAGSARLPAVKLHFVPPYCPHLNSIERLWGLMHRHITHNKCYATFREFSTAMLTFLREEVPKNWHHYCDAVITDNFRVINPTEFRIIA